MKTWTRILFFTLLVSGLPSCFYSDSEMYFVEPIAGEPPQISVSTNLDSLYNPPVNDSLEVDYLVEISGGEFYYLFVELAGSVVFESDSSRGIFWSTPLMADSVGIDTLHMSFYYSANTNTLADRLGYEVRAEYLDYALYFNTGGE